MSKSVRPTIRFNPGQYELIKARLKERDVTFQQYCLELICNDLGVPLQEFTEQPDGQITMFEEQAL